METRVMKNFSVLVFCLLSLNGMAQKNGYKINVNIKPYKNAYVFLGFHYGKNKGLADSAFINNMGQAVFTGKTALPGGIYFITSPRKEILFELLIDKQQFFSITADTLDLVNKVAFVGSPDNLLFQQYTKYMSNKGRMLQMAQQRMNMVRTPADSVKARQDFIGLNMEVQKYREELAKKNPQHILAALFAMMKEPTVPPAAQHPGGKYDSLFAYQYYKKHYWDGIYFNDGRLVRTPNTLFENRFDNFFKYVVSQEPDSISYELGWMMNWSRSNKEMFKYLINRSIDKYINAEVMGQDKVFTDLYEKYFGADQGASMDWLSEKQKKYITERYYSLIGNKLGEPASPLEMVDTTGKPNLLYNVKAKYTVVVFWDPTCSHCKETVPKVDSIFKAKWKANDVALYAVMTKEDEQKLWKDFIRDNKLADWLHVYQTPAAKEDETKNNRPNYRQLYDVFTTPVLYLLDEQKRIIAKKLSYQQLDEVMDRRKK
jgi:thiol-disulfide isomerase/thioredoxin